MFESIYALLNSITAFFNIGHVQTCCYTFLNPDLFHQDVFKLPEDKPHIQEEFSCTRCPVFKTATDFNPFKPPTLPGIFTLNSCTSKV